MILRINMKTTEITTTKIPTVTHMMTLPIHPMTTQIQDPTMTIQVLAKHLTIQAVLNMISQLRKTIMIILPT